MCFPPAHRLWPPEGGAATSAPGTRAGPGKARAPRAHLARLGPWLIQWATPPNPSEPPRVLSPQTPFSSARSLIKAWKITKWH